jgi:glycosyltransferase involved in cell wall biosynthesis
MRIFMTADAVGGVWQYTLDLASGLRDHDVDVTLAVLGPAPSLIQEAAAARAGIKLQATGLPLDWTASRCEEVEEAAVAVARLAVEAEPDVVHLNHPALAATADYPVPVVAVCHSCVATWWQANRSEPLPTDFVWRTDLVGRGYRNARALTAPTAAFAAATSHLYGLSEAPRVVRNGRRPVALTRADTQDVVFTAGRLWDDGKNILALDRVAARLSVPVLAAGPLEGPNGARIALDHIRPLGHLSDTQIAAQLSVRPIFVSTARYEPFGLAVLEAAQAGCALVLSDIPTFRELWDDAAIFVAPDDEDGLAGAIERLVRDADSRTRFGNAARERSATYTVEAMSSGMLSVYRSLVRDCNDTSPLKDAAA